MATEKKPKRINCEVCHDSGDDTDDWIEVRDTGDEGKHVFCSWACAGLFVVQAWHQQMQDALDDGEDDSEDEGEDE